MAKKSLNPDASHSQQPQQDASDQQQQQPQHAAAEPASGDVQQQQSDGEEEQQQQQQLQPKKKLKTKKNKMLSQEKLRRLKEQHDKRGIVYVSRLPPHMKPAKLRQLLSAYGDVGRIYCTPEDASARQMRKKKGGNSGKNFTEGWVEFEDKAVAKQVAAGLNGQQIGGKRRSAYHYDLWCMKYLPKFKWDHLTEEIAYEKAVREQRMAQELAAAKRERDFYLSRVDRAKALDAMEQRRQAKQHKQQQQEGGQDDGAAAGAAAPAPAAAGAQDGGGSGAAAAAAAAAGGGAAVGAKRSYGQRKAKAGSSQPGAGGVSDDVLGLLVAPGSSRKKLRSS